MKKVFAILALVSFVLASPLAAIADGYDGDQEQGDQGLNVPQDGERTEATRSSRKTRVILTNLAEVSEETAHLPIPKV